MLLHLPRLGDVLDEHKEPRVHNVACARGCMDARSGARDVRGPASSMGHTLPEQLSLFGLTGTDQGIPETGHAHDQVRLRNGAPDRSIFAIRIVRGRTSRESFLKTLTSGRLLHVQYRRSREGHRLQGARYTTEERQRRCLPGCH